MDKKNDELNVDNLFSNIADNNQSSNAQTESVNTLPQTNNNINNQQSVQINNNVQNSYIKSPEQQAILNDMAKQYKNNDIKKSSNLALIIFFVVIVVLSLVTYLLLKNIDFDKPKNNNESTQSTTSTEQQSSSGSPGVDAIISAKDTVAKNSTLGFVDSIEYYIGLTDGNDDDYQMFEGYDVKRPTNNNDVVICSTNDGINWTGSVDDGSTKCDTFMNAVKSKHKGSSPQEAKILIATDGRVENGTWMKYNGYYCLYNNGSIEKCSKEKVD